MNENMDNNSQRSEGNESVNLKKNQNENNFDNYFKDSQLSEKTIQTLTQMSKDLSSDFNETSDYFNDDTDDIPEIIEKDSEENVKDISDILEEKSSNKNDNDGLNNDNSLEDLEKPKKGFTLFFRSTIYVFLFVFCISFITTTYFLNFYLTPIQVIGESMQPTLNLSIRDGGHYLGLNDDKHCDIVYCRKDDDYDNNEIVVFKDNNYVYSQSTIDTNEDKEDVFLIKRIVATENQVVTFNRTSFNLLDNTFTYSVSVVDEDGSPVELDSSYQKNNEEMTVEKSKINLSQYSYPVFYQIFSAVNDEGYYSYTVPEDHIFVMGDNRNNSIDSRYFGAIKITDIEGEVKLIVPFKQNVFKAIFIKIKSYF